jgi:hypothetical protein
MKFLDSRTEEVTKEQLENAVWEESLTCMCYEYTIAIKSSKLGYLELLKQKMPDNFELIESEILLPHFSIFLAETSEHNLVFYFFDKLYPKLSFRNGETTFEKNFQFLIELLGAFHAARNEKFVILHAGAVSYNGVGIIFPADSYSGKSSLTAEFVKQGATYFSDEYAIISKDGRLHPFSKPISIREPGGWTQTDVDVASFGGESAKQAVDIGYVLFTKFRKYARWRPKTISRARAVFDMLPHSINGKNNPEFTIQVLQNAIKTAKVLESSRGESRRFVKKFLKSFTIDC